MKPDIRLLIVDDNIVTRYALRRRLECHGYRIDEAGTGGEGLELIASQTYDALILDVHLPDMSGFDIVRILRATPATALLPVIHVSAAAIGTGDIITGLDAGADAYLIHPVDPEVLLATLRTLLRVRDTEQALRESEARFREIFVSTAAPIALLGTGLKVHECNQAFAQLIQDNLSPDTLVECFADDQQPVIDELLRRLGTRDRWKGLLHMRVNGQLRETQWQVSPYRSGESSLIFVEDVTEQRHRERTQRAELDSATTLLAQEVAERARTEAQLLQVQKMDALGKLTGGIAHDFNNMLTGIITSLELIKKRIEQGRVDKVQSYADAALGAAMGAATLTHRLLAFARQQPLDPRPADINQHIRSLEELLRRTIGEHISLHLNLSEHLSVALVDPIQLENAVLNLVINARDALPQGGNIWISTYAAHTQDDLKLADGAYVALSVRDDGSGIAPEVIGKVFDPFFTTKPIGQGTGLGLSTIYGFARQSAGDVQIRSTGGRGTEVTLLLPASQSPLLSITEPTPDTVISTAGEHVLVVEDMSVVRSFVCEVLTDAGYRCTPAPDVESALQKLHADPSIALLLSDVGLPHMNGRELANVARMLRPSLPVLFMTGYAENAIDRQHFLGERMDIVTKPFQIHELLDKVRRSLDA
ncbi:MULTISPECIES: response regulator [Pseudomonas]|jgi:PAS domain S-box-containing protein|uniref:histidine kinase n=2 Tax=Pseudomonas TaxID=286 RepID=A0A9X8EJX7_PSEPU|nr:MULTISPECIES: response regulator [Pseudomonas]MBG8559599.1 response regulator [Pseudomonas qingdaonensis]MCO7506867.1 response regulator [Pseudomonas sp. VE 267-6A]MCO7532152.1 response regulator [Pseudomonas sp. 2]MCP8350582.1 response regulator [Pseudomonas sp. FBF18]MDD1955516.1 response regulator [Pseudomonas sp. 8209]